MWCALGYRSGTLDDREQVSTFPVPAASAHPVAMVPLHAPRCRRPCSVGIRVCICAVQARPRAGLRYPSRRQACWPVLLSPEEGTAARGRFCLSTYLSVCRRLRGPLAGQASAEMLAQRSCLGNPHIVQFREAVLTTRHLAIVMEHARGGDLRVRGGRPSRIGACIPP